MNATETVERVDATCADRMCGDKATYVMTARCYNCGWVGEAEFTKGHERLGTRLLCPRCECREIHCKEFVE